MISRGGKTGFRRGEINFIYRTNNKYVRRSVFCCGMIKPNVRKLFLLKGIRNPRRWMTARGIPDRAARQLLNETGFRINYSYINILCVGLHCTVDDLFVWTPDEGELISAAHPLHRLRETEDAPDVANELQSLTVGEIKRVGEFVRGMRSAGN